MIYLDLLSKDAAEGMDLRARRSTGWHPGQLLLSPENSAGTVSPQSAHTAENHNILSALTLHENLFS